MGVSPVTEPSSSVQLASLIERVVERHRELAIPEVVGDATTMIAAVVQDSRSVISGSLFACIPGASVDGHDHAAAAVEAGAVALLTERQLDVDVAQVIVPESRGFIGPLASAFHGDPSRTLEVIGITGTNGKTTCVAMLAAVLSASGRRVATIGTLSGARTTPEACDLQAQLAGLLHEGIDTVVMEVSSHALSYRRVDGTRFSLAIFTNLGRDHLDLHQTMEEYFRAKARLFEPELSVRALVNVDDVYGRLLADIAPIEVVESSSSATTIIELGLDHQRLRWRDLDLILPLGGEFNSVNARLALDASHLLGVDVETARRGIGSVEAIPGRFEVLDLDLDFTVIVDYAHTPDGLESLLASVRRAAAQGRLILVFGCGGDRDQEKRTEMGMASASADLVIVTSDNPRSEDPDAIIAEIVAGIPTDVPTEIESDRAVAIELALRGASPGDVVIIAGKGHESTQEICGVAHPFDDRVVATSIAKGLR
jgi:UDP-N-acetylmuramoyl-L-alanyl-D-glutamate--2,6-diaminopimelate ligase